MVGWKNLAADVAGAANARKIITIVNQGITNWTKLGVRDWSENELDCELYAPVRHKASASRFTPGSARRTRLSTTCWSCAWCSRATMNHGLDA